MKKDEVAMNIIGKKCECFFLGHIVKGKITAIKTNENLCSVYVTFDNPEPWGNEVHKGAWFSFDVTYKIGCLDSVIIDEKSESEHIKYYTMTAIFKRDINELDKEINKEDKFCSTLKECVELYESTRFTEITSRRAIITSEYNMPYILKWISQYAVELRLS